MQRREIRIAAILVALGVLVLRPSARAAQAPQAAPQTPPVFRAGVDVVQLDVSVLDKNRQPVHGLTAADFTVIEDGVPQPIVAFTPVEMPGVPPPTTRWKVSTTPDVTANDADGRRLFLIVMDDATVQLDPAAIRSAKAIAGRVIDQLGPNDLAAVVFTLDNRHAQDFTADRAKLKAAAETFNAHFRDYNSGGGVRTRFDGFEGEIGHFESSVDTLDEAAYLLAGAPGRRKALVYIGQGVPFDASAEAEFVLAGPGVDVLLHEEKVALVEKVKRVFEEASRSNVNFYPMDICGLRPERAMACGMSGENAGEVGYLETLADNTGGRATVNTNDFEPGIAQMFVENGSYYLIGYRQLAPKGEDHFIHLDVKVDRPGLEVRSRHYGYNATTDASRAAKAGLAPPSAVVEALAGLLPNADTRLRVAAASVLRRGASTPTVLVTLGVTQPAPAARTQQTIDVLVRAFTPEGDARGAHGETLMVTLAPDHGPTSEYEVMSAIDLKPGRYELRASVHNHMTGKDGSVYADVTVPDIDHAAVWLSGLMLHREPALPLVGRDALAVLTSSAPTTMRQFDRGDRVTVAVDVGEAGRIAPVALVARILNDRDQPVYTSTLPITADRFEATPHVTHAALDLPLAALPAGDYLFSLTTNLGKTTATRDVQFSVK